MKCNVCQRPMTALFLSYVCDYCDGLTDEGLVYDRGFVVWRPRPTPAHEYVFCTREDAEQWRAVKGSRTTPCARFVRCRVSLAQEHREREGLQMADRLIEIFPNRKHPPGPNRAFFSDGED